MQRRDFVTHLGLGIGATAGLAALGLAESEAMAADKAPLQKRRPMSPELKAVLAAALDCVKTGSTCLAHCQNELANGDTSLAECQKSVMNVIAICESLTHVAAYNNASEARLKAYAKVCAGFCDDCAKACERHTSHHIECKECFDSCKACVTACEKYAA